MLNFKFSNISYLKKKKVLLSKSINDVLRVIFFTLTNTILDREEIEKQKAKERYMKMHLAGKTDQAKADLARLAIIRKQREDAAKKKEEEKKGEEPEQGNHGPS